MLERETIHPDYLTMAVNLELDTPQPDAASASTPQSAATTLSESHQFGHPDIGLDRVERSLSMPCSSCYTTAPTVQHNVDELSDGDRIG